MSEPKVYFRGTYSYRKWHHLVVGLVLAILCVPAFLGSVWIVATQVHEWTAKDVAVASLLFLVFGTMGWAGCGLCYHFWKKTIWEMVIDSAGVRHIKKCRPWSEIRALWLVGIRGEIHPVIGLRWSPDRNLVTDPGLTPEQATTLLQTLKQEVAPLFPHVRFP